MLRPRWPLYVFALTMALQGCGPATPPSENAKVERSEWEEDESWEPEWQESDGEPQSAQPSKTRPTQPSTTTQPGSTRPASPGAAVSKLGAHEQAILDRHNLHRADHCAQPLQWSPKLTAVAQSWANQLKAAGCAFEHSQRSPYGENLSFFAPVGSSSPDEVATGWYSEVSEYNFTNGSFGFNTGHFTQVVWRGTQAVGCARSHCNGGELWVCNYDPPGNMSGAFAQNVRPKGCAGQ
jgi:uncharacterized protein YkwD